MIKQTSLLRLEWNAEKRWHTKFHTDRRSGRLEIYSKLILCRVVLMQKIGPASAIGLGSNRVLNGLWDIVSNNWWAAHEQELDHGIGPCKPGNRVQTSLFSRRLFLFLAPWVRRLFSCAVNGPRTTGCYQLRLWDGEGKPVDRSSVLQQVDGWSEGGLGLQGWRLRWPLRRASALIYFSSLWWLVLFLTITTSSSNLWLSIQATGLQRGSNKAPAMQLLATARHWQVSGKAPAPKQWDLRQRSNDSYTRSSW